MTIDSGGTGGPHADEALFAVVDRSNVHGDLPGDAGPLQIARRFVAAGWSARASAFDEYELPEGVAGPRTYHSPTGR